MYGAAEMMDADDYQERLNLLMPITDIGANLRFADLFAGIGGFHVALARLGLTCGLAIEQCTRARAVYAALHGIHKHRFPADVMMPLPANSPKIDVLCGGFPCQPYSTIGKRKGFFDPRGLRLVQRLVDIIYELYPAAIILENVAGLFKMRNAAILEDGSIDDGGLIIDNITGVLEEMGYDICIRRVKGQWGEHSYCAHDFGIPQARPRLFIVGFRRDLGGKGDFAFPDPLPQDHPGRIRLGEIVGGRAFKWSKSKSLPEGGAAKEVESAWTLTAKGHGKRGRGSMEDGWRWPRNRTVYRIKKANGEPDEIRELSLEERLQLMGLPSGLYDVFPDGVNYPKVEKLRQTGNSVVAPVVYHLARAVVERVGQIDPQTASNQFVTTRNRSPIPVIRHLFHPRSETPSPIDPGHDFTGRMLPKERKRRKRLRISGRPQLPTGPRPSMISIIQSADEPDFFYPEIPDDENWEETDMVDDDIRQLPTLPEGPRPRMLDIGRTGDDDEPFTLSDDEPLATYPKLSDDEIFVRSLGFSKWFRYADSQMETTALIYALDRQLKLIKDCVSHDRSSRSRGAWWRVDADGLWLDIKHRNKLIGTLAVKGGMSELESGLRALRQSACDYSFEALLCKVTGKKFDADEIDETFPFDEPTLNLPISAVSYPTIQPPLTGWTGNKLSLIDKVLAEIPFVDYCGRLVEPFGGSGAVGLNLAYRFHRHGYDPHRFLIADRNPHAIFLLQCIFDPLRLKQFDEAAFKLFNSAISKYKSLAKIIGRTKAGQTVWDEIKKEHNAVDVDDRMTVEYAASTLWLQQHGFNSMLRYNLSNEVNSTYRSPPKPYPAEKIDALVKAVPSDIIELKVSDYHETMSSTVSGEDVVYCDPPYASSDGNAANCYYGARWTATEQRELLAAIMDCRDRGVPVLVSNEDNEFTRSLYRDASTLVTGIAVDGKMNHKKRPELIATYLA